MVVQTTTIFGFSDWWQTFSGLLIGLFGQLLRMIQLSIMGLALVVVLNAGCHTDLGNGHTLDGIITPAFGFVQDIQHLPDDSTNAPAGDPVPIVITLDNGQFTINGKAWDSVLTIDENGEVIFDLSNAVHGGMPPFTFELWDTSGTGALLISSTNGRFSYVFKTAGEYHLLIKIIDSKGQVFQTGIFIIKVMVPAFVTPAISFQTPNDGQVFTLSPTSPHTAVVSFQVKITGSVAAGSYLRIKFSNLTHDDEWVQISGPGVWGVQKTFSIQVNAGVMAAEVWDSTKTKLLSNSAAITISVH